MSANEIKKEKTMMADDFLGRTRFRMLPVFTPRTQTEVDKRKSRKLDSAMWNRLAVGDRSLTEINCCCRTSDDLRNLAVGLQGMTQVRVLRLDINQKLQYEANDARGRATTARLAMEDLADCFLTGGLPNLEQLEWYESHGHFLECFASRYSAQLTSRNRRAEPVPKLSKLTIHCWAVNLTACERIARFLGSLCSLESISLSLVHDERLVIVLEGVIGLPLRSLMLATSMYVSEVAAERLVEIIAKNQLENLTVLKVYSGFEEGDGSEAVKAHSRVLDAILSNTSIARLTTNCLFQNNGGQNASTPAGPKVALSGTTQVRSLRLLESPSRTKLPNYALCCLGSSVQELIYEDVVEVHEIPRITTLLQRLNTSSSIRRLVVRKALLDRGLGIAGPRSAILHEFLRAATEMEQLEHLTIGSVGDAFVRVLSEHLGQFRCLRSLTLFTYRVSNMECLVHQMRHTPTLCDVRIWPSNPRRRLLPPETQFQSLEWALHRNRLRAVAGNKNEGLCFLAEGQGMEGRIDFCPPIWPHLLSRLGRVEGYDEHGEQKVVVWHDVANRLLREKPEILHRPFT